MAAELSRRRRLTFLNIEYILARVYNQTGRKHRMKTARIFKSGNSQAVRLPKEFHLEGAEVYIKRVGPGVLLIPKGDPWASLSESLDKFSEDFLEERVQPSLESRETF
jgi:antitoxin VapB